MCTLFPRPLSLPEVNEPVTIDFPSIIRRFYGLVLANELSAIQDLFSDVRRHNDMLHRLPGRQ
jgi:hypothetical protein